jgi:peptidoglycan/xylan/chitin deacetylase (PgdA/CDA1 family)
VAPELSVVIATRNRRELLARCIAALAEQDQDPATFEVVVSDDGSEDGTAEMVEGLRTPFSLGAVSPGRVGRGEARNAAIEAARGAVCLILDDDVVPDPGLLAAHLAAHREHGRVVCLGRLTQAAPERRDWYARAFADAWNEHFEGLAGRPVGWADCYGGNMSAPRDSLLEVGGFADGPIDDAEIGYRLERAGCTVRYLPEARGLHDDQKPRARLLEDSRRQGAAAVEVAERVPEMVPKLLGWFGATRRREVALRRAMIAIPVSPALLARLGAVLPGFGRRRAWFQFVSRLAFWRGVRRSVGRARWEQLTWGVPVLMYHAFSDRDVGDRYVVPRRAFSRQLRILRLMGYTSIHFDDLVGGLRESRLPPRRAVAITIDDGYRDNLEIACPILRRHGFSATLYLISEKLGGRNDWSRGDRLRGRPMLSVEEIKRLRSDGVRIGAHTRSHPHLPELSDEEVETEVSGSRADLESLLHAPVPTFAYPYGELDERAVEAVRGGGFLGACTVEPRLAGLDEDPLRVPRVEVRSTDSLLRFALHLWLGAR